MLRIGRGRIGSSLATCARSTSTFSTGAASLVQSVQFAELRRGDAQGTCPKVGAQAKRLYGAT